MYVHWTPVYKLPAKLSPLVNKVYLYTVHLFKADYINISGYYVQQHYKPEFGWVKGALLTEVHCRRVWAKNSWLYLDESPSMSGQNWQGVGLKKPLERMEVHSSPVITNPG